MLAPLGVGERGRDAAGLPLARHLRGEASRTASCTFPAISPNPRLQRRCRTRSKGRMDLSIVIPIKDERDNLGPLLERACTPPSALWGRLSSLP